MNLETVIVTGAAGFIGRWVVKELLNMDYSVIGIDNFRTSSQDNIAEFKEHPNFRFIKGDVRDEFFIYDIVSSFNPDFIIHLAAQINVHESLEYPFEAYENNIRGTYNILETIRLVNKKCKLVLMGTCMVYDVSGDKPIDENHPVNPASPYAATKLAAENLAIGYHHGFDIPVTVLRPFNTYGPYQRADQEGGVVSIFISRKIENKPLLIYGDGKQTRDLLYISDLVDFVIKAMLSENTGFGEVINAGTGKDISIKDLAKLVQPDISMHKFVPHHHPQSEIMKLVCDYSKAKNLLGWEPRISLSEGIRLLEDFLRKQD